MPEVDKKYLDLEGLQALINKHAVVVHPQPTAANPAGVKVGTDSNGHVVLGQALAISDITDLTSTLSGKQATLVSGTNIKTVGGESLLGSGNVAFKTINSNSIIGSGDISLADLGLSGAMHFKGIVSGSDLPAVTNYNEGDVIILGATGKEYVLALNGSGSSKKWNELGDESSHALKSTTISGDGTYITGGGTLEANRTLTHKSYTAATAAAVKIGRDTGGHVVLGEALGGTAQSDGAHTHSVSGSCSIAANTVVTSTTPNTTNYSWSLNKGSGNANLSTVPIRTSSKITVGNANTGTQISIWGLKTVEGALSTTTASKATAGTAIDVAKAGTAVVYGTADCDTAVTGVAQVGSQITYGNANVGSDVSLWGIKTKTVNNSTVADTTLASKATPGTAISVAKVGAAVTYGTADCDTAVTGVAQVASSQITYGNANVGSAVSVMDGFQSSGVAYQASYDSTNEKLVLTALTPNTKNITPAATSSTKAYVCKDGTGVSITPAKASSKTLTPAASNGTITPYTFADVTVPVAATAITSFKSAATSSSQAYVCADGNGVSIVPAKAAPSTQKIVPAVSNGQITPYTFANVTVPVAATATTSFLPAAASSSSYYLCSDSTVDVFNSSTSISVSNPSSGAQAVLVTGVTDNKTAVSGTISGTAASDGAHTHTLSIN